MAKRVQTSLALGVTAAVLAVAGCGGGSGNSFTIKANDSGDVAYLVVDTAVPHRAIEPVLVNALQDAGADAFVTSSKPTGALDCSWHGQIGAIGIPDIPSSALLRYYLKAVSVQVYGSGVYVDGVCSDLLSTAAFG